MLISWRKKGIGADLFDGDAHVAANAGHGGGQEHGGGDLAREPLHGEGDAEPAEAVAHQDEPVAVGGRGHRVQQRPRVVLERRHLVEARRVHPRRGHVERRRPVTRGAQPRHHLVPAPRAVGQAVHQDEVLAAAALHLPVGHAARRPALLQFGPEFFYSSNHRPGSFRVWADGKVVVDSVCPTHTNLSFFIQR